MNRGALVLAILALFLLCLVWDDTPPPKLSAPISPVSPIGLVTEMQMIDPACPDLNADGYIGDADLRVMQEWYGLPGSSRSDFNRDGAVDIFDVVVVARAYGAFCGSRVYMPVIFKAGSQ